VHPLDEYPIHQAPLSMRYPATSDRDFYDRCIFQGHDRTGEIVMITGLGVYPNLGVIDAYLCVRRGDRQWVIRTSDALGDDRMSQTVGPYRIDVIDPLTRVRIVCDSDAHGLVADLTFQSAFPPIEEPHHVHRGGDKLMLDASRFAQVGSWEGVIRLDGEEIAVTPDTWIATRDRSWGIRPVGEQPPPGRPPRDEGGGFWWVWSPLRFDDFAVMVIAQEQADGHRVLNHAVRVWPEETGRSPEQLGWPEFDIRYKPGTRYPEHASVQLATRGKPLTLDVQILGAMVLTVGCGYNGDPDWGHGQWRGEGWVEGTTYDYNDAAVAGRVPFSVIDHVARVTLDGSEGWGIFEHASIGRHDPSGMADFTSVG
jgi:hypothetical protein